MLLRFSSRFAPSERGDSDLCKLSNTIRETACCEGDSAVGTSRCGERVGCILNPTAVRSESSTTVEAFKANHLGRQLEVKNLVGQYRTSM